MFVSILHMANWQWKIRYVEDSYGRLSNYFLIPTEKDLDLFILSEYFAVFKNILEDC